ncbi:MAG: hypothetical protein QXV17_12745 [Candidatus Micrarchaeaceae archaeon]
MKTSTLIIAIIGIAIIGYLVFRYVFPSSSVTTPTIKSTIASTTTSTTTTSLTNTKKPIISKTITSSFIPSYLNTNSFLQSPREVNRLLQLYNKPQIQNNPQLKKDYQNLLFSQPKFTNQQIAQINQNFKKYEQMHTLSIAMMANPIHSSYPITIKR